MAVNDTNIEEVFPDPSFKPGSVVKKEVRVKNNGSDTYVRMQILFSDSDMQQYCTVNWNTTDWELKSDGYYYYKKILPKGSKTTPLFTTVTVSKNAPEDEMKDFDIIVREESLQVGYFKSADEAWSAYKKEQISKWIIGRTFYHDMIEVLPIFLLKYNQVIAFARSKWYT